MVTIREKALEVENKILKEEIVRLEKLINSIKGK